MKTNNEASEVTISVNSKYKDDLDFNDKDDYRDANRGFLCTLESGVIYKENPTSDIAYDMQAWDFLGKLEEEEDIDAPDTANPSLWRQSKLNRIHGLFEVLKDRIYQIRGFDIANMTFVKGDKGWIVIDVLGTKEVAAAGLKLFKEYLSDKNKDKDFKIAAIIITHPHADHYGGIEAFDCPVIIGPKDFMKHAVSENIYARNAMHRRARYMYGMLLLPKVATDKEKGTIGSGLGQTNSTGKQSLQNVVIEVCDEKWDVSRIGLEVEFMYVTETEAPCEIMMYFPRYKAFCVAEEINRNMHNLVTLRGAKVRNGLVWSKALDKVVSKYGDITDISFSTHHWPTWNDGNEGKNRIKQYWEDQRDLYRYLHDQTLWHANRGLTPIEIAEAVCLPDSLGLKFYNRGYYGTTSHNVKSQYQMYFGWFDGNPANLNPLTPMEAGKKYVEAIGADRIIEIAGKILDGDEKEDDKDYRWAAMLLNHLVFAEPDNGNNKEKDNYQKARALLADVYKQLAYQSESGPWRNFYLTGADELRNYPDVLGAGKQDINIAEIAMLNAEQLFDYMAINLDANKAEKACIKIDIHFTDTREICKLTVQNSVLNSRVRPAEGNETAKIEMSLSDFKNILVSYKNSTKADLCDELKTIFDLLDFNVDPGFNIVVP